jgi:hypothetical protein
MNAKAATDVPRGGFRLMVFVTSTLAIVYFTWAWDRITFDAFDDPAWPRPFPYPDSWLAPLLQHYDKMFPLVTDAGISIHGNFPLVQFVVCCAWLTTFAAWLASGIGLSWRATFVRKSERRFLVPILALELLTVFSIVTRFFFWPGPTQVHLAVCATIGIAMAMGCAIPLGWRAARLARPTS